MRLLTGRELYEKWRPNSPEPHLALWDELTDDQRGLWSRLGEQLNAKHLVPRRMVYNAVRNLALNELALTREVVVREIEQKIRTWCTDWLHAHTGYVERIVKAQLVPIVQAIVKDRIVVTVAPQVTVEVKP